MSIKVGGRAPGLLTLRWAPPMLAPPPAKPRAASAIDRWGFPWARGRNASQTDTVSWCLCRCSTESSTESLAKAEVNITVGEPANLNAGEISFSAELDWAA